MQPRLPGPGSFLIKIKGYTEDGAVFSTHPEATCSFTHSLRARISETWSASDRGAHTSIHPNLRNGVQWWKGSTVADKAASEGITPAGLYCFPSLDGIMA